MNLLKRITAVLLVVMMVLLTACEKQVPMAESDNERLIENEILRYASGSSAADFEDVINGTAWGVDISIPVDWSAQNVESRDNAFKLNSLYFLDVLYLKYYETQDISYAEKIIDYIMDWAQQNTEVDLETENWPWNDDTTARRMLRMSFFYAIFKDSLMTKTERETLEASMALQAETLCLEEFYTKKHNHGMHQDLGLVTYALLVHPEKEDEYIETALPRTLEYLNYVFTEDGIHKEHSPMYAIDTLSSLTLFQNLTEDIAPEFSKTTAEILSNVKTYLIQFVMPDGHWMSVGDSAKCNALWLSDLKSDEKMIWINDHSKGEEPETDMVFEKGGYAFFRSSWYDSAEEGTWMMLNAATFSSIHKHGDDLEVLLYHKGELFVEAGRRDYNYAAEQTAWSYSGYGHNVLTVDGNAFPVIYATNAFQSITEAAMETCIKSYDLKDTLVTATGIQKRFEGIVQERTLTYDKTAQVVTVADVINSEKSFDGCLLWHIAEGVEVVSKEGGWSFMRDGETVAEMTVTADCTLNLETVTGEGEYPYCTWLFGGNTTEPTLGSLLKVNFEGQTGTSNITAVIELK